MLGLTLLELLSEALGLKPNHLIEMGCAAGHNCNYYPACPEPNRTMGVSQQALRSRFLHYSFTRPNWRLQVLYQNQWADIPPVIGALLILETFFRQVQLHIIEETIY